MPLDRFLGLGGSQGFVICGAPYLMAGRLVWTVFVNAARASRRFNVGGGYLPMLVCEEECLRWGTFGLLGVLGLR